MVSINLVKRVELIIQKQIERDLTKLTVPVSTVKVITQLKMENSLMNERGDLE